LSTSACSHLQVKPFFYLEIYRLDLTHGSIRLTPLS
jgi:hypothetical protein